MLDDEIPGVIIASRTNCRLLYLALHFEITAAQAFSTLTFFPGTIIESQLGGQITADSKSITETLSSVIKIFPE
jgi:hypothetical protein